MILIYISLEGHKIQKNIPLDLSLTLLSNVKRVRYLSQLPGRLFSPSDKCKKLSHHFLLHFPIGMGSYDHHAKYQGVFP